MIRNFLRLLSEKGRTAQIDEIYREFEELVAAEQKRLTVELTTAYELSDDEAATIVKKIEKSSGRSVEATRKVDSALIGGIILQVGSHRARRERPRPHRPTTPRLVKADETTR